MSSRETRGCANRPRAIRNPAIHCRRKREDPVSKRVYGVDLDSPIEKISNAAPATKVASPNRACSGTNFVRDFKRWKARATSKSLNVRCSDQCRRQKTEHRMARFTGWRATVAFRQSLPRNCSLPSGSSRAGMHSLLTSHQSVPELERTPNRSVIRAMNYFPDCHREERSDVANQLIDCSRGLPQSPRLLRNDKRREFVCRARNERRAVP
jgi:hypothetical protein